MRVRRSASRSWPPTTPSRSGGCSNWIAFLSVFSSGFALGLTTPATNLLVAEINSERRAAALNILSFAWALGAVAGPPLIALFARDGRLVRPLIGLAALLSFIALLITRRPLTDSSSGPNQPKPNQKDPPPFERSTLRSWATFICVADRRTDLYLRGNRDRRRWMDRLLRAASWRVSERVWDDNAVTVPQRKRARRLKPDARLSVVAERAILHPPQRMSREETIQVQTLLRKIISATPLGPRLAAFDGVARLIRVYYCCSGWIEFYHGNIEQPQWQPLATD